jgi:cephalosporin-C deacetylase
MLVNLSVPYNPLCSPPRSDQMSFTAPSAPDFLFGGDIAPEIFCQPMRRGLLLEWWLSRNMVRAPLASGRCEPEFDSSFSIRIETANLNPGFYDLRVRVALSDTVFVDGITTFGWNALDEPLVDVRPADFDNFWKSSMARMKDVALDLSVDKPTRLRGDEIGRYNVEQGALPEHYDPEGERYDEIEVAYIDYAAFDGSRIYATFAKPAAPGVYPGMLVLPGAGNAARPAPVEHARHGYAAIDVQIHGNPVQANEYDSLPEPRYSTPEEYVHYRPYLNALQSVNALLALPGVDGSRLSVVGGSQGGRLSTVVSGLDSRICAAVPGIAHYAYRPWLHWTERLNVASATGAAGFSRAELVSDDQHRVESYFDIMNFAPLIRCHVLMNAGLIDAVSPPSGIYATFRRMDQAASRQVIALPNMAHDWRPAFDKAAWRWLDGILGYGR